MGHLVLAAAEGRPSVQLLDLDTAEATPVPTAIDRSGHAFDHALARDGWVAVQVGYEVIAFSDGSLLRPVELPSAWQMRPGAAPDEVLLTLFGGGSRGSNELIGIVAVTGDGTVRRSAELPLWFPAGEIDGWIVTRDALWSWSGEQRSAPDGQRFVAAIDGELLVMQDEARAWISSPDGAEVASCDLPRRTALDSPDYDARASHVAATAFRRHGVLVADRRAVRWIALPFEPHDPLWLDDHHLHFYDYDTEVAHILDTRDETLTPTQLPKRGRGHASP